MDREIPKEERQRMKRKRYVTIGCTVAAIVAVVAVIMMLTRSSVSRKDLVIATVDHGTIQSSVSASGKVVPAFEEIINSPINTRIVEVYSKAGDSVDVGTPLLRLDLQSAETELDKLREHKGDRGSQNQSRYRVVSEIIRVFFHKNASILYKSVYADGCILPEMKKISTRIMPMVLVENPVRRMIIQQA